MDTPCTIVCSSSSENTISTAGDCKYHHYSDNLSVELRFGIKQTTLINFADAIEEEYQVVSSLSPSCLIIAFTLLSSHPSWGVFTLIVTPNQIRFELYSARNILILFSKAVPLEVYSVYPARRKSSFRNRNYIMTLEWRSLSQQHPCHRRDGHRASAALSNPNGALVQCGWTIWAVLCRKSKVLHFRSLTLGHSNETLLWRARSLPLACSNWQPFSVIWSCSRYYSRRQSMTWRTPARATNFTSTQSLTWRCCTTTSQCSRITTFPQPSESWRPVATHWRSCTSQRIFRGGQRLDFKSQRCPV